MGLDEAAQRLDAVRSTRLAAQLGGAAGTLAAMGDAGIDVLARFARELELAEPVRPVAHDAHADRGAGRARWARAAARWPRSPATSSCWPRPRSAEVREGGAGGRGGSSAMPHKHNPVAAISALAGARQAPGLVANLLGAMEHEHERAAGAWHAEWAPLRELLRGTGSAAAWLRECLEHLEVDPERMRANLDDALLAERVAGAIGGPGAGDLVREALAAGRPLADVAREHLGEDEARRVLDPADLPRRHRSAHRPRAERARPSLMTPDRRPLRDRRPRRRADARPVQLAGQHDARCGTRRSRRWPSACAWCATTTAATAAHPSRPAPTRSPTSAPTPWPCSTV